MKHKNRLGKIMNREHWQKDDSMVVGNGLVCYSNFSYLRKLLKNMPFEFLPIEVRLLYKAANFYNNIIPPATKIIFINFGSLSERYLHLHIITNIKLSGNYSYTWNKSFKFVAKTGSSSAGRHSVNEWKIFVCRLIKNKVCQENIHLQEKWYIWNSVPLI